MKRHDVVIIGAGQGGLSTSYYLTRSGIEHVVLDKVGVGNAWRNERWDSFCLVTPNWSIRLPGAEYAGNDPNGFMVRDEFVAYLEDWARGFGAPVREKSEVLAITGTAGAFELQCNDGVLGAKVVVVATATFQKPRRPAVAHEVPADIVQLHAAEYRNPRQPPAGGVLVVGSGQTGCQFAEELHESGRETYLCVGRTGRLPRRYRGRDVIEWQRLMGMLDRTPDMLDNPAQRFASDPHVSGRYGGYTISLHDFQAKGIRLLGRLTGIRERTLELADDLADNLSSADEFAAGVFDKIDTYIEQEAIEAPPPTAAELSGGPPSAGYSQAPLRSLDIDAAKIRSVIWATGFDFDFDWIDFPVRDAHGYPQTQRGVSAIPGLYFMGLNWMYKRKSGILYGVGDDAAHVASHIRTHLGAPAERVAGG